MITTTKSTYRVAGMSCGHCRSSVLGEVREIDGVSGVELDLKSGRMDVEGADVSADQIRSAVDQAGYKLEEVA